MEEHGYLYLEYDYRHFINPETEVFVQWEKQQVFQQPRALLAQTGHSHFASSGDPAGNQERAETPTSKPKVAALPPPQQNSKQKAKVQPRPDPPTTGQQDAMKTQVKKKKDTVRQANQKDKDPRQQRQGGELGSVSRRFESQHFPPTNKTSLEVVPTSSFGANPPTATVGNARS